MPEMGEYLVGAYLKLIIGCDFVDYNVRPPGGGLKGLEELDLVGINIKDSTAYLCEVTTHIGGLLYKNNQETVDRITRKYERQQKYADEFLKSFTYKRYMFWSPVVPKGYITENLAHIEGLDIIINADYAERVHELRRLAKRAKQETNNPFFRSLQILENLRE